jgi:hypothetical protein
VSSSPGPHAGRADLHLAASAQAAARPAGQASIWPAPVAAPTTPDTTTDVPDVDQAGVAAVRDAYRTARGLAAS